MAAVSLPATAATETVLYSFTNSGTGYPLGTLYLKNGSLYGTGSGDEKVADRQVFRLTNYGGSWKERTLVTFDGANGSTPYPAPVRGADGTLYGTTSSGDAYKWRQRVRFVQERRQVGRADNLGLWRGVGGWHKPLSDLVIDRSGNLYGTTFSGGAYNAGTVFELSERRGAWTETILYSFSGQGGDGWEPYAGLLMDRSGSLY